MALEQNLVAIKFYSLRLSTTENKDMKNIHIRHILVHHYSCFLSLEAHFYKYIKSEALASSASSEGRVYNSSNRRPGVRHSTFESLRLGHSSQSIASGFLCFWDFMNFKKDMEFVGITVE
ncbi:hypothetical protein YC2023_074953 [Brassica napus]